MSSTGRDGRATRWDSHRRERRRELLRAVRAAIAAFGEDVTMEQISQYSGTSKPVLYRYFGDRRGLRLAMGEWAMSTIRRRLQEAEAPDSSPRAVLYAMISAYAELAAAGPDVYRFCNPAVAATDEPPSGDEAPVGGFFADITGLLCERLGLTEPTEVLWGCGAIGFVRAATDQWLHAPADLPAFAGRVADWLAASAPAPAGRPTHAHATATSPRRTP